jgi:hypothetical protein
MASEKESAIIIKLEQDDKATDERDQRQKANETTVPRTYQEARSKGASHLLEGREIDE